MICTHDICRCQEFTGKLYLSIRPLKAGGEIVESASRKCRSNKTILLWTNEGCNTWFELETGRQIVCDTYTVKLTSG